MKRSSILAAVTALTAAAAVATPALAATPVGQYRGTVKNGGKFIVDVNGGKVTTLQAYFPVNCQSTDENVGGEILLNALSIKLKNGSFTINSAKVPKATIKGTFNKAGTKVTGTIKLAQAALKQQCAENGGPASNPPVSFSGTQQPH